MKASRDLLTRVLPLLALALAGVGALAQTGTLVGDTYVSRDRPAINYGTLTNFYVNASGTALLRFDLGALPTGITAAQVSRATLRVYANRVNTPGTLTVAAVQGDWRENAVTAQTVPPIGTAADVEPVTDEGQWIVFDVTAAVRAWIASPAGNYGLALQTGSADVVLDSKENDSTAHPATLEISASSSGGSAAGAKGDTGAQGPAGPQGPSGAGRTSGTGGIIDLAGTRRTSGSRRTKGRQG